MAADMHLHILEGITEDDIAALERNTLGSKYFNPVPRFASDAYDKIANTPQIWVGSVSWLGAFLMGSTEADVPGPVLLIQRIIGENLPEITDQLIAEVGAALTAANTTCHHLAEPAAVIAFLQEHRGKKVFTISW